MTWRSMLNKSVITCLKTTIPCLQVRWKQSKYFPSPRHQVTIVVASKKAGVFIRHGTSMTRRSDMSTGLAHSCSDDTPQGTDVTARDGNYQTTSTNKLSSSSFVVVCSLKMIVLTLHVYEVTSVWRYTCMMLQVCDVTSNKVTKLSLFFCKNW